MEFLSRSSTGKTFLTGTHDPMDSLLNVVFGVSVALGTAWAISALMRAYRRHSYARALSKYDALGYLPVLTRTMTHPLTHCHVKKKSKTSHRHVTTARHNCQYNVGSNSSPWSKEFYGNSSTNSLGKCNVFWQFDVPLHSSNCKYSLSRTFLLYCSIGTSVKTLC